MDNLRRPKRHAPQPVDGIVRRGAKRGRSHGTPNRVTFRRTQAYQPELSNTLNDFKRPEGFHAIRQPVIQSGGEMMASQNVAVPAEGLEKLEEPKLKPAKRRGFFKRRHKDRKWSWKKRTLVGALSLVILLGATGGLLFMKGYLNARRIFNGSAAGAPALQQNVDPTLLKGEGDGRVNILLLGKGGPGHDGPDLTDTILVASIDPLHHEAALVSIPRDLYVKVPNFGWMKINAAYANAKYSAQAHKKSAKDAEAAGLSTIQTAIQQTLGIPIHYYTMVDFEAFRKAIDTVGGVDINVTDTLYDPTVAWENNNNPLIAAKGMQHMDGKKALLYARSRHGSVRGDFDRAERQRQILVALKDKVFTLGTYGNPLKINQLIDAFGDHVESNLSTNEVMRLYTIGKQIDSSKVASVGLADPPNNYVTTSFVDGQSVVIPRAGQGNYTEIQSYIRNTLKDGYIRDENPNIMILNGTTTPGLATAKATELKSYGYSVTQVGDAPTKNYAKTILVDLRSGTKKYTKHYLEQRFNTTAVTSVPDTTIQPGTADFVIILGADSKS